MISRDTAKLWKEVNEVVKDVIGTVRAIRGFRGLATVDKNAERKLQNSFEHLLNVQMKMGKREQIREALKIVDLGELREGGEYICVDRAGPYICVCQCLFRATVQCNEV